MSSAILTAAGLGCLCSTIQHPLLRWLHVGTNTMVPYSQSTDEILRLILLLLLLPLLLVNPHIVRDHILNKTDRQTDRKTDEEG